MLLRFIWSPRALSVIAVAALLTAPLGESAQAQSRRCTKGGLRACNSSRTLVQSGVAAAAGSGIVLYAKGGNGNGNGKAKGQGKNGCNPGHNGCVPASAPPAASDPHDQTPTTATPEPATMALLGTGLAALGGWRKRRRSKAA